MSTEVDDAAAAPNPSPRRHRDGQQPPRQPSQATPQPPRTGRPVLRWVAVAVVALVVLSVAGVVLTSTLRGDEPSRTVELAERAGGLVLVEGRLAPEAVAAQLEQASELGLGDPRFGLYARPGQQDDGPYVLFTGGRTDGSDPATAVAEFIEVMGESGAISGITEHDPGPLGGQHRCAGLSGQGSATMTLCFWIDEETTGSIVLADPTVDRAEAAALLSRMRADLEPTR